MKSKNIILVLCIHIILSSLVIYFFCICHLGSFSIVPNMKENLSNNQF